MQELQKINGSKDRDSDGEKLLDCVLNYMMFEKDVTGWEGSRTQKAATASESMESMALN